MEGSADYIVVKTKAWERLYRRELTLLLYIYLFSLFHRGPEINMNI
jgi:hypothetical protein